MTYEKSPSQRFIIYCATHYRRVIISSAIVLIMITFYKVFFTMINPVVVKGTVLDYDIIDHGGGRYGGGTSISPVIQFQYENKTFRIEGVNTYHIPGRGEEVEMIFNKSYPAYACEYSLAGFTYNVFPVTLSIGVILSCVLLAFRRIYSDNDELE
jgi:hypothetical protein